MSEHESRKKFDDVIKEYEKILYCVEGYFKKNARMNENDTIQCIEADPTHLECIVSDGNVLHIHYDELEQLLQGEFN